MRIHLARSAGFCFGVRRALDMAFETAKSHKTVCMLGNIVHNEDVIAAIKKAGIKKIRVLREGQGKILLLRAHGASRATIKRAQRQGYSIIDATCPMVKEIHKIATTAEKEGNSIIIIGDKKHDEVRGIIGQLKGRALLIDDIGRIPWRRVEQLKKVTVVTQSTQNHDKVKKIITQLRTKIPCLKFYNTICGPTRTKQAEIKSLPLKNNVVIVIGSKTSANTRRLYEIAKMLNPRSYWIHSKDDIRREWFRGAKTVGVTSGASTPRESTQAIIAAIEKL